MKMKKAKSSLQKTKLGFDIFIFALLVIIYMFKKIFFWGGGFNISFLALYFFTFHQLCSCL